MNILKHIGYTPQGNPVFAGAFQMADTIGFPLSESLAQATNMGAVISIPHYFASAMEAGWTEKQVFSRIQEAFQDARIPVDMSEIEARCIAMFMQHASDGMNAMEVGKAMREELEG